MGAAINFLRGLAERIGGDNKLKLYIGGILITFLVILLSGITGWLIERLFIFFEVRSHILSILIFSFILSTSLATRSLIDNIFEILNLLNKKNFIDNIGSVRKKLSYVVGRDVESLDKNEILRASAETASENSVDGIFAPLFWMFVGMIFWQFHPSMPGPLSMAWIFKASSTIDSMIGYKEGNLKWLGFAGAKFDDMMTWIPSRLVLITLPFCCRTRQSVPQIVMQALKDGQDDPSPNSGISEAIFAHCAEVRMGGINYYKGKKKIKPLIAKSYPLANIKSVKRILYLSIRLQYFWIFVFIIVMKVANL